MCVCVCVCVCARRACGERGRERDRRGYVCLEPYYYNYIIQFQCRVKVSRVGHLCYYNTESCLLRESL